MSRHDALEALQIDMRNCTRCLDAGHSVTAGAVFSGTVGARVMLVGQAPGPTEAVSGIPFCGASGRRLFRWLADVGWQEDEFRRTQYITAITKCFPGKGKTGRGDRVPTAEECRLCAPFLERELDLVAPQLVLAVGGAAIARFLGSGPLDARVGQAFHVGDRTVVPLPHPSGANLWLNRPESQALLRRTLNLLRGMREGESL
jgi:uracil-DNA glycosylase